MHKFFLTICAAAALTVAASGITASQEWVKHYVTSAAPTTNIIDSVNAILNAKNDDEIKVTADGQIYFTTLECVGGVYTNVTHFLTPGAAEWVKGTYHGAKVTASTDTTYRRGDIFALAKDKSDGSFYYVNGNRILEAKVKVTDGERRLWVGDLGWSGETPLTKKRLVVELKDATGNTSAYFVLEPILLWEETWRNLLGEENASLEHDATTIPWAADATLAERKLEMVCTYGEKVRKMLRSGALPQQPTTISIKFRDFPVADYVDTIDYAAAWGYWVDIDGKLERPTHENCWAEPEEIVPEYLWNRLECWIDTDGENLKPAQVVTTWYKADDGLYYPTEKKIRTLTALRNLLAQYPDTAFPPFPWPGFALTAKTDCRKTGDHIYGKNCECIVCGHQREHSFPDAKDGKCSRCENRYDEYTVNFRGEKKKTGKTTAQQCGVTPRQAGGDVSELALHSGWWHQSVDGDTTYNCSCECGFYSTDKDGHRLEHEYDPNAVPVWGKTDKDGNVDGIHHYAYTVCSRCNEAQKEIKERHELHIPDGEERLDGSCEPYNTEYHHAHGVCRDCLFGEYEEENALMLEEHDLDDGCFCRLCNETVHSWTMVVCGSKINHKCERCNAVDDFGVDSANKGHEYGKPLGDWHEQYLTHHACHCGFGELEPHTFVNGKCSVCGVGQMPQVKCASKRNRHGDTSKTNEHMANCEHLGGFYCNDLDTATGQVPADSEGSCPYCGGNFFRDYPEAVACADKAAKWEWTIKGTSGEPAKMDGNHLSLTAALDYVVMTLSAAEQANKFAGNTITLKIWFDPVKERVVQVKNFAFLGNTAHTISAEYAHCAEYRGVIVEHPKHGTIISWE